jgi:amino acid permease
MKRIGIIRYLGILVVVMVFYLVGVTVAQAHSYVEQTNPQYQPFGTEKLFDYLLHFGLFLFAFNALPVFHQVYVQLELPTVRRIRKIGRRVSLLLLAFYALFTLAAYISLGSSMQASSFDIFPNKKPLPTDPHDIYMKILKIVFMICLLSTYVANSIPLKTQLRAELGVSETRASTVLLSLLIVTVTGFFSYVYPDISNWFSIMGSLGATSMIAVLPSLMYWSAFRQDPSYLTSIRLVTVWAVFTSTLSFSCLICTILDMQGIHPNW